MVLRVLGTSAPKTSVKRISLVSRKKWPRQRKLLDYLIGGQNGYLIHVFTPLSTRRRI
jgi:hypothetical protein